MNMTQLFVGLGDQPFAMVLGKPTRQRGMDTPDLDNVRCFVVPRRQRHHDPRGHLARLPARGRGPRHRPHRQLRGGRRGARQHDASRPRWPTATCSRSTSASASAPSCARCCSDARRRLQAAHRRPRRRPRPAGPARRRGRPRRRSWCASSARPRATAAATTSPATSPCARSRTCWPRASACRRRACRTAWCSRCRAAPRRWSRRTWSRSPARAPGPEAPGPKRMVVGTAHTRPFTPAEIGRMPQIVETARAVAELAGELRLAPADVHLVQMKGAIPRADHEAAQAARRAGAPLRNDMVHSRAASALGVALALGEVARGDLSDAVVCDDWSLWSGVASCSAKPGLQRTEILMFGNSARAARRPGRRPHRAPGHPRRRRRPRPAGPRSACPSPAASCPRAARPRRRRVRQERGRPPRLASAAAATRC